MELFEAIATRRSVRRFTSDPVSRALLERIVDAGRLAPTARNVQPWEFVVVTDADRRRQLADLATNGKFIAEAPACIVLLSKDVRYYVEDGSAATTNMLVAAAGLNLGACWVAGDKKPYAPEVVALCGAPADMKLVSMMAIGHAADVPSPSKRSLQDVLHWGQLGKKR